MKNSPPSGVFPQPPNSRFSAKEGRSGYEPSDTETEWQEVPRHERTKSLSLRSKTPMAIHRRHASRVDLESSSSPPRRRNHSKSPYKPFRVEADALSPMTGRHVSLYKSERETVSNGVNKVSEKADYRRSVTAPRQRGRDREQQSIYEPTLVNTGRNPAPLSRATVQKQREGSTPSIGEINEMVAEVKLSKDPNGNMMTIESTESSLQGDIFFSRECNAMLKQKTLSAKPNVNVETQFVSSRPNKILPQRGTPYHHNHQPSRGNGNLNVNIRGNSSSTTVLSRSTTTISSTAAKSKKNSGKLSSSSVKSDVSGKTSASTLKFIANRKNQVDVWFACMRKGACKTSNKSPEHRLVDEASIIERALVVQSLPQFWADKYQPASLDGFICHQQEAQLLKELVSQDVCPHILLKGPRGSGKRALAMALLREIYGDACSNLSHDLRDFTFQDRKPMKVAVSITSSPHHVELNVNLEPNARYALMGLVKEISSEFAITPEVSYINFKANYKVMVLYEVDKAADNIQHLIKWIIDRYSDTCKLVVCCEDDADILEPVKNRFKLINVDAPQTDEIIDVLIQIAKQEEIDLSMNFAAKIAMKSKQNLRKAIMALEACRAHNYPFSEEQSIPIGWEETLIEISGEILSDPSYSRLFSIRGKLQKLLGDFVHPKLILRKLVEQLLKGIEGSLKRELFYWHAYYEKRLPPGTTALLKLEEFVAKFMSIYRKSSGTRQFV